jgi:hypothetical protein
MTLDDIDPETLDKIKSYGAANVNKVAKILETAVHGGEHTAWSNAVVIWLCSNLIVLLEDEKGTLN